MVYARLRECVPGSELYVPGWRCPVQEADARALSQPGTPSPSKYSDSGTHFRLGTHRGEHSCPGTASKLGIPEPGTLSEANLHLAKYTCPVRESELATFARRARLKHAQW
jgi:hypothetical protein